MVMAGICDLYLWLTCPTLCLNPLKAVPWPVLPLAGLWRPPEVSAPCPAGVAPRAPWEAMKPLGIREQVPGASLCLSALRGRLGLQLFPIVGFLWASPPIVSASHLSLLTMPLPPSSGKGLVKSAVGRDSPGVNRDVFRWQTLSFRGLGRDCMCAGWLVFTPLGLDYSEFKFDSLSV